MTVEWKASLHLAPELIEEYCFGRVPEPALQALEEHLLQCAKCQIEVAETDRYIALMKQETARYAAPPTASQVGFSPWFTFPKLPAFSVLAAGSLMLFFVSATVAWRSQPAASVALTALRGGATAQAAQAPAGRPLQLSIDATSMAVATQYQLQLVDAAGQEIWTGTVEPKGERIAASVQRTLRSGMYWVRLYSTGSATPELQREFALEVR